MIKNQKMWKTAFQNTELKQECQNVLHMFEIFLVILFTNAKVKRLRQNELCKNHRKKSVRTPLPGWLVERRDHLWRNSIPML